MSQPAPAHQAGAPEDRSESTGKMAERLARKIEDRIIAMGWPVGTVIGSEPQLLSEYGTSRAVFREAVRILEHHAIARMRRGPGGGLVVTEPDTSSVVRAAALNLKYNNASLGDIFDARSTLELKCAELAAQRIDEDGIHRLRDTLSREAEIQQAGGLPGSHDIHLVIAELTGNPAMRLFLEVLTKLTLPPRQSPAEVRERSRAVRHAHEHIVEAIVSGDAALARHRMQTHLIAMKDYYIETGQR